MSEKKGKMKYSLYEKMTNKSHGVYKSLTRVVESMRCCIEDDSNKQWAHLKEYDDFYIVSEEVKV